MKILLVRPKFCWFWGGGPVLIMWTVNSFKQWNTKHILLYDGLTFFTLEIFQ